MVRRLDGFVRRVDTAIGVGWGLVAACVMQWTEVSAKCGEPQNVGEPQLDPESWKEFEGRQWGQTGVDCQVGASS